MALIKTTSSLADSISAPWVGRAKGPVCLTCLQTVDEWGLAPDSPAPCDLHPETGRVLREATRDYALVLVKHHGAEELRRYDMGSRNWDMQDVKQRMDRTQWFNPSDVGEGEEASKHARARPVNDEDEAIRETISRASLRGGG